MRTYNYSNSELDFLARLAFYDVKKTELRKREGGEVGNRVWSRIHKSLCEEFELNKFEESNLVWELVSKKYEEDLQLVDPQHRFDKRGLPFD